MLVLVALGLSHVGVGQGPHIWGAERGQDPPCPPGPEPGEEQSKPQST